MVIRRGYFLLDMDYRGPAGNGRAWRTTIYRKWIHRNSRTTSTASSGSSKMPPSIARIGTYGDSYGAFMALMALFKTPDAFADGAALRPVTDSMHYNHG